jgi:acyl-CoA thioesterase YciA
VNRPTPAGDGEPCGKLTVQLVAMPRDTNANGDIFGGWVVSQMDIACGVAARDIAQGRAVTVAIDAMTFIRPVKVGDVLCVYTALERIGRTSMKKFTSRPGRRGFSRTDRRKLPTRRFTFVAIDDAGRPRPVLHQDVKAVV